MDTEKTTKREAVSDVKREKVRVIPIQYFDDFPNNPFHIQMDEEMDALVESIKEYGILTPLLARKTEQERYEIISGRRRKVAAKKAGLTELPVILRDLTRDEAIIAMVDSNLQRERILPSEKAYAYKMKIEARNRQGKRTDLTSTPVVSKFRTSEEIGMEPLMKEIWYSTTVWAAVLRSLPVFCSMRTKPERRSPHTCLKINGKQQETLNIISALIAERCLKIYTDSFVLS